ncbi:MAG: TetR/AcrR family transcriptional regulator [Oscillospiraceae bacterium]|nr:TetR/AcrR family transcriptional regulator [Oscillospiraceae bacterium]
MKTDMRVAVSKRMLREGLLRCLEAKPISKITVSELCIESGINRATFYNHYDAPIMILKEMAHEYFEQLSGIYETNVRKQEKNDSAAIEACLEYISERKTEIKVLFSEHAEHYLAGVCMEIINEIVKKDATLTSSTELYDEYLLRTATSASAVFGFIQIWLTMGIDKTPKELVGILKNVVNGNMFR